MHARETSVPEQPINSTVHRATLGHNLEYRRRKCRQSIIYAHAWSVIHACAMTTFQRYVLGPPKKDEIEFIHPFSFPDQTSVGITFFGCLRKSHQKKLKLFRESQFMELIIAAPMEMKPILFYRRLSASCETTFRISLLEGCTCGFDASHACKFIGTFQAFKLGI